MNDNLETFNTLMGSLRHCRNVPVKKLASVELASAPTMEFKVGLNVAVTERLSWCGKISKLTSLKHRNTLLRVAHG